MGKQSSKMQLVFATNNEHKFNEIRSLLKQRADLLCLSDLGIVEDIEEIGSNLKENALIKAKYVFDKFGYNVFADDTGLEVDALNGEPGVFSARYAGDDKNSDKNIEKLLLNMKNHKNRDARFKTVIALFFNGNIHFFDGIVEGTILENPIGNSGFGYDPIFKPNGFDTSFAQMDLETKNIISHRGRAIEKLMTFLFLS